MKKVKSDSEHASDASDEHASDEHESIVSSYSEDDCTYSASYTSSSDQRHTHIIHDAQMVFGSEIDASIIDWKKLEQDQKDKNMFAPLANAEWKIQDEFLVSYIKERFPLFEVFIANPYFQCEENRVLYIRIKDVSQIAFEDEIKDIFSKEKDYLTQHAKIRELLNQDAEDLYLLVVPHIATKNL